MQYNAAECNTRQDEIYKTIQYNTIVIQDNIMQYNIAQYSIIVDKTI